MFSVRDLAQMLVSVRTLCVGFLIRAQCQRSFDWFRLSTSSIMSEIERIYVFFP